MDEILYIRDYYYSLLIVLILAIFISFFSYLQKRNWRWIAEFLFLFFAAYTVFYIGDRSANIGVDTSSYKYAFELYKNSSSFQVKKDAFYDFFTFICSKILDFQGFLKVCSFLYVFSAYFSFKKIFRENFYLPFLIFLISPYFFQFGINVMRNGIAASLFLGGIASLYKGEKKWKVGLWMVSGTLFHLSMVLPLAAFFLVRYLNRTAIIFTAWLFAIVLALLNVNFLSGLVGFFDIFATRFGDYTVNREETNSWGNFLIFGAFPVLFAVFNILRMKYRNTFYSWMTNSYMLIHIPYIILINSQFALRLGYLAEFMMPVLLIFPLMEDSKIQLQYSRLKLSLVILLVFLIKGYKILV